MGSIYLRSYAVTRMLLYNQLYPLKWGGFEITKLEITKFEITKFENSKVKIT